VSRRADPRQQTFWPQPSALPSEEAAQSLPQEDGYPAPPSPPLALTPFAAEPATDPSDGFVDVERTAQVFSSLLPLLRQLKERAEAAAASTHNCRTLSGVPQTSAQDAIDERTQGPAESPDKPDSDPPRNQHREECLSKLDARTTPRTTRHPSAGLEEEP